MKNNLKKIRVERGLSMESLGNISATSATNICHIEQGKTNPSIAKAYSIAIALEVCITEVFPPPTPEGVN